MGLDHGFLLVATARHKPSDCLLLIGMPRSAHVHDDLISYIGDTLRWIPSLNPATGQPGFGFNSFGPTAVLVDGAQLGAQIFEGWARLLTLGPPQLKLCGQWTTTEGDPSSGHYDEIHASQSAVTGAFSRIASDLRRVAASDGAYFLLHFGI